MRRFEIAAALAALAFPNVGFAHDGCVLTTNYVRPTDAPPAPTHVVSFVFTGVDDQPVLLSVDEMPVFEGRLTTADWSNEYSGATRCLMAGRYRINVKIGEAEGNLFFAVSEQTTIYLNGRNGVLTFNVWGPDAPGLD
jgi:hypothetical protein